MLRRSLRPPLKPVNIPLISNQIHGFQQRLEEHTPSEYHSNISSFFRFRYNLKAAPPTPAKKDRNEWRNIGETPYRGIYPINRKRCY